MKIKDQTGFSLIEVLVAAAILGVVLLGMETTLLNPISSLNQQTTRNQLASVMQQYAGMAASIRNSALQASNSELRACLTVGTPGELDCVNGQVYPLQLYGPFQGVSATLGDGPTSGPPSAPMGFSASGVPCTATDGSCAFEISTSFRPICPYVLPAITPAATCDAAVSIEVTYVVQQVLPSASQRTGTVSVPVAAVFGE